MAHDIPMHELTKIFSFMHGTQHWDFPLSRYTWFRVGGPTPVLFSPESIEELSHFVKIYPHTPFILGAGSNLLVRDGGIPSVVIKLGKPFHTFVVHEGCVELGAGLLGRFVAQKCQESGHGGLGFLYTIPGTIGGALSLNAGCYGYEIQDVFLKALAMDPKGEIHMLTPDDMGFSYRHCSVPPGWIFLKAWLRIHPEDPEDGAKKLAEYTQKRDETQPQTGTRTGGSTFKNPPGLFAWKLIDAVGYRGKHLGGAQFSPKHCNFLVNTGNATAADLERLGEDARMAVLHQLGVDLHWEIMRVGVPETP